MAEASSPTDRPTALSADAAAIVAGFAREIPDAARRATQAIADEIPVYRTIADPTLLDDVEAHVVLNFEAIAESLRTLQPVTRDDLVFVRAPTARRARIGLPLEDYLHAFRVGHRVAWETLQRDMHDAAAREAALSLVGPLLEYINIASTHVAEVYVEVRQMLVADGSRARRDLLDDLLAGRRPPPGPRDEALRALRGSLDGTYIAVSATASSFGEDDLAGAATMLSHVAGRRAGPPLIVVRGDELVALLPIHRSDAVENASELRRIRTRLVEHGHDPTIGASSLVAGLQAAPDAYAEAVKARAAVGDAGILCLFELSAFEYLARTADATAFRLLKPQVTAFVADDLSRDGTLCATIRGYAESDLNVTLAAERLHVHVNTARHRLARVAERSGQDLRVLGDVIELLLAIELARRALSYGKA